MRSSEGRTERQHLLSYCPVGLWVLISQPGHPTRYSMYPSAASTTIYSICVPCPSVRIVPLSLISQFGPCASRVGQSRLVTAIGKGTVPILRCSALRWILIAGRKPHRCTSTTYLSTAGDRSWVGPSESLPIFLRKCPALAGLRLLYCTFVQ